MMPHNRSAKTNVESQAIKIFIWQKFKKISMVNTHKTKPNFFFASFKATEEEQATIVAGIEANFPNMKVHHQNGWNDSLGRFCRLHIEKQVEET